MASLLLAGGDDEGCPAGRRLAAIVSINKQVQLLRH